jgi:hypothetical protein
VLREKGAVKREELREVNHGVSWQSAEARRNQNIAGGFSQPDIAGEYGHDDSLNSTPIKRICLNNEYWAPEARL